MYLFTKYWSPPPPCTLYCSVTVTTSARNTNISPINVITNFCSLIIYTYHVSCVFGSRQPYFSHTILISHNTVWSHVGFFKWMGRVCCTSHQNHALKIHALLLHLMWRQFITPVWHATIFKKDFAFSFIKIAFPVLHHNIYFSLLLCSIFSFDTFHYSPKNNQWRREIVIFLGWLACKSSTRGIKMNLRRPHTLLQTLYKIRAFSSQTKIKPLPIQTIPSLQVSASHQFPPTPISLIFSCRIKFILS